jgi:hypothetical protein
MGTYPFTQEEIDKLPTILDVVEDISRIENNLILPMASVVPSSPYYDEGRYNFVSDKNNQTIVRLMPMSQSPTTFFRGQNKYYSPCVPSIFRGVVDNHTPSEEYIAASRIKTMELGLSLCEHPVFKEVCQNEYVDIVTMAQHYGLATEYLDVTNSKWVAAFFASSGYDYNTDSYYPVGRDFGDGLGVMYISKVDEEKNVLPQIFDRLDVIGYQYFQRPTKQSSFGYRLNLGEDFNNNHLFDKVFFRHDLKASQVVFEMSYRQDRFIPKDSLSKLARQIKESKEVSRAALFYCWNNFYSDKEPSFLDDICAAKGWAIREQNGPIVQFSREEIEADWKAWNEYGREDLRSRILPVIPITCIPVKDGN